MKPTGEEGIQLIKALCGLRRMVSNVNIPNTNLQIKNLPADAIVETNAVFERDAIRSGRGRGNPGKCKDADHAAC